MNRTLICRGLYVAITTPFADGRFDPEVFGRHIEHLIAGGIEGLVPCGTTGEAATLDHAEKRDVIARAVEVVKGRVPVLAGVGTNSTRDTLAAAADALDAGADGLLVVTPYYNKPPQDALFEHYRVIAAETAAPIVVYNVPSRTSVNILPETLARLAELPEIVAVKDATADLRVAAKIVQLCGDRLTLLSGDDFTALPLMAVGGKGCISVVGNVDPRRSAGVIRAALAGDFATARRLDQELLPLAEALFTTTNPIPVKAAVALLGFGTPEVRLPLLPLGGAATEALARTMRSLGLL
jgi:4-hydroxy-tetrahydrodipicolinate synthase